MKRSEIERNRICIIAGMPRAGTTFLYHTLPKNPDIFVPSRKETDFFSVNYYRGIDWYLDFFRDMGRDQVGFDISPIYFLDSISPERIKAFNPNARVVLVIRSPVEWILSFFKHLQAKKFRKIDFKSFLNGYIYRKDSKSLLLEFKPDKITSFIKKYCEMFGESLLLCDYRVFSSNPLPVIKSIEKFSGASDFFMKSNFENKKVNASADEPPIIINFLMQQKIFADLVTKLFPKSAIMTLRYKLQTLSNKTWLNEAEEITSKENRVIASRFFGEAVFFMSDLFGQCGLRTGDGSRYDWNQK